MPEMQEMVESDRCEYKNLHDHIQKKHIFLRSKKTTNANLSDEDDSGNAMATCTKQTRSEFHGGAEKVLRHAVRQVQ